MIEVKQDGEDMVFFSRDRGFGGKLVECLRLKGGGDGRVSTPQGNFNAGTEAQIFVAKGTILAASVATLHATPVAVIPAPPAGSYIDVVSAEFELVFNSAAYDAVAGTDFLELRYTNGSGTLLTQTVDPTSPSFGNASATAWTQLGPAATTAPLNAAVVAFIAGTEWFSAAGDSALDYHILYRVRPLNI